MRIDRLDLTRFGNFTDSSLDLSTPGTHVVIGANEAGKTTAMAAIRQLFFGIPQRTNHAFLHEMRDLRIAAAVRGATGGPLEIVRLKRRKDSLQDPEGNAIGEKTLARLLHDVDQEVFTSLFTIGHDEIAAGGEALLAGDGEVGKAIFSASRGTTDLNAVLRALDERAAELFKSGGSKPALNAVIRRYKDERAEVSELSSSASSVVDLDKAILSVTDRHAEITATKKGLRRRIRLLEEIRNNRPHLATRHDLRRRTTTLEAAGELLEPGLSEPLQAAREQREDAQTEIRTSDTAIERLDGKLADLVVDAELIDQQEAIEQLQSDTGGYRQNLEDLPGLEAKAGTLRRELERLRQELPDGDLLGGDGRPALTIDQVAKVDELAASRTKLVGDRDHARNEVKGARSSLERLRADLDELDEPAEIGTLTEVCIRIRKEGALEAERVKKATQLAGLDSKTEGELQALGLTGVDRRAVGTLRVPTLEVIRQGRDDAAGFITQAMAIKGDIERIDQRRTGATDDLQDLLGTDQPPSVEEMAEARSHRENGWQLVRAAWLGSGDDNLGSAEDDHGSGSHDLGSAEESEAATVWAEGRTLDAAYERAVEAADDVADRLRRDADAVARRAALETQILGLTADLEAKQEEMADLRSERDEADAAWAELWKPIGITPDPPTEMELWRDTFRAAAQRADESRTLEGELSELDSTISRDRTDLTGSLDVAGLELPEDLSLTGLLDHAEEVAERGRAAQQALDDRQKSVADAEKLLAEREDKLSEAQDLMTGWEKEWTAAIARLGLADAASPAEAKAVLGSLSEITSKSGELEGFERRISGIEKRNTGFNEEVAAVLTNLTGHLDAAELEPSAAVKILARRLGQAQEVAAERKATTEERDSHVVDRDDAATRLTEAEEATAQMVKSAGVPDEAALADAITSTEEHADLADRIAQIENDLRASTGKPVDQVANEAAETEALDIVSELEELGTDLEQVDRDLKEHATKLGELQKERSLVDASGEAAEHMLEAQQSLAELVDHADEFVRTILAKRLLEEQVDAYRDENQGPLLARARELFRSLTLDRYTGIDTDTDPKGSPFILAQKADEKLLKVDELSTGTRDQLYLSLRIAALEQFMERRGPLPLVLDDLFVNFDDERTEAGLRVLDALADETQVLLFSHHHQVAAQARQAIDADRLTVHELG